jgi:hypothetical protein
MGRNHRPRRRRPHHRPRLGGPPWRSSGPAYHDRAGRRRRRWRSHARRRRRRLHAGLGRRLHDAQSWRNRLTRAAENLPWLRRRSRNRGRNDPARGCSAHGCGRFLCWRRRLFGGRRSSARFSHRGRCRLHRRSRRRSRRSRWRYDGRRGCLRGSRFDRSAPCQRGTNRLRGSGDDGRQIGRCCGWRRSRRGRLGGGDWWGLNRRRRSRLGLHARSSFRRCFGHGRRRGFRRNRCRRRFRRFLSRLDSEVPPDLVRDLLVYGAGVGLLLRDAELGQQRQDHAVRLLTFSRQLVDSNFLHTALRPPVAPAESTFIAPGRPLQPPSWIFLNR